MSTCHGTTDEEVIATAIAAVEAKSLKTILVTGIPCVPAIGNRSKLSQQLMRLASAAVSGAHQSHPTNINVTNSEGEEEEQQGEDYVMTPKCRVGVSSVHRCLDETATIFMPSNVSAAKLIEQCGTLKGGSVTGSCTGNSLGATSDLMFHGEQLHFSFGAGKVRDHAFPLVPFHVRRQISLDPVATFSITNERTAGRMANLLRSILGDSNNDTTAQHNLPSSPPPPNGTALRESTPHSPSVESRSSLLRVVDGMACTGGNTWGFLKYFQEVTAVEMDPSRAKMLRGNMRLMTPLLTEVSHRDSNAEDQVTSDAMDRVKIVCDHLGHYLGQPNAASSNATSATKEDDPETFESGCAKGSVLRDRGLVAEVLFLDPPWGGPQYAKEMAHSDFDIVLSPLPSDGEDDVCTADHNQQLTGGGIGVLGVSSWRTVSEMVLAVQRSGMFGLVAVKLPAVYDVRKHIVDPLLGLGLETNADGVVEPPRNANSRERDFPFLFPFGSHTQLLVLARNDVRRRGADGIARSADCASQVLPSPRFRNSTLDGVVQRIMKWQNGMDRKLDEGCREHKPTFFDFEKLRWIQLKKWKGSKEPMNPQQQVEG